MYNHVLGYTYKYVRYIRGGFRYRRFVLLMLKCEHHHVPASTCRHVRWTDRIRVWFKHDASLSKVRIGMSVHPPSVPGTVQILVQT
jgi:hypothetical protein